MTVYFCVFKFLGCADYCLEQASSASEAKEAFCKWVKGTYYPESYTLLTIVEDRRHLSRKAFLEALLEEMEVL